MSVIKCVFDLISFNLPCDCLSVGHLNLLHSARPWRPWPSGTIQKIYDIFHFLGLVKLKICEFAPIRNGAFRWCESARASLCRMKWEKHFRRWWRALRLRDESVRDTNQPLCACALRWCATKCSLGGAHSCQSRGERTFTDRNRLDSVWHSSTALFSS